MKRLKTFTSYMLNNLVALVVVTLLTACGGGDPAMKDQVDVTSVTVEKSSPDAASLRYGSKASLTVKGQHLDRDITVRFPGCANLVESSERTDVERSYTCNIESHGYLPITVLTTNELSLLWFSKLNVAVPRITMFTSMGKVVLELNPDQAPATVKNFIRYVNEGFYTKTIFHRVVSANAILGGSLDEKMKPVPTHEPIELENTGLSNLRGTISMASATAQFLINVADNQFLDTKDGGYPVFGKVISGMDVLDAIKAVETKTVGTYTEVPVTPITIESIEQTQ